MISQYSYLQTISTVLHILLPIFVRPFLFKHHVTVIAKLDKLLILIRDIHWIQSPAAFVRMNEWNVRFEPSRSCQCQLQPQERVVYEKEIQIWRVYSACVCLCGWLWAADLTTVAKNTLSRRWDWTTAIGTFSTERVQEPCPLRLSSYV